MKIEWRQKKECYNNSEWNYTIANGHKRIEMIGQFKNDDLSSMNETKW